MIGGLCQQYTEDTKIKTELRLRYKCWLVSRGPGQLWRVVPGCLDRQPGDRGADRHVRPRRRPPHLALGECPAVRRAAAHQRLYLAERRKLYTACRFVLPDKL